MGEKLGEVGARADLRDLRASCVRFGRLLRHHGLPVGPERVMRWLRALDLTGCDHPADLFWSGRVTLVSAYAHLPVFDDLFRQFWLTLDQAALDPLAGSDATVSTRATPRRLGAEADAHPDREPGQRAGGRTGAGPGLGPGESGPDRRWQIGQAYLPPGQAPERSESAAEEQESEPTPGWYSEIELLREKDFSAYEGEDQARLQELLRRHPCWVLPLRRSRRLRPTAAGGRIDLRRTVGEAIRRGGDPVRLARRARATRWRKWVFLCDISASMAPYSRGWLMFLQALTARRGATEVFLFGTRLTRVTPQLRRRHAGALTGLSQVRDWHGGTRLGEALDRFHRQYGRRGMTHGAVLFILSDGLDLGRPGLTAEAMSRLQRAAHRIVWANPLKRTRDYEPSARAMSEAMPYLDDFVSGHNLQTLADLVDRQVSAER